MNITNILIGRRQLLFAAVSSIAALVCKRAIAALDILSGNTVGRQPSAQRKALKGIVVYYSATGSTRKVAQAIHNGMKTMIACDIVPVKKADPGKMGEYDVIAIGSPIWYNRETANITRLLLKMPRMDGKLCFPFCTHGRTPNGYFYSIAKPLRKIGLTIIGWNDWFGSVFHVLHMPKPYHTDGHPDSVALKEAEEFGRSMAERAQKIYAGEKSLIPEIPAGFDVEMLWRPFMMERTDYKDFYRDVPGVGADIATATLAVAWGVSGGAGNQGIAAVGDPDPAVSPSVSGIQSPPGQTMPGANVTAIGQPQGAGGRGGGGMGMRSNSLSIDLNKCVYPRCRMCMDACVENVIDLSMMTAPSAVLSGEYMVIKDACVHCMAPLCQRMCSYDAFIGGRTATHSIDKTKCTYPKCTLCADNCPMNSIDLTQDSVVLHNNCEGCDVCYCVCPTGAVVGAMGGAGEGGQGRGEAQRGQQGMPGPGQVGSNHQGQPIVGRGPGAGDSPQGSGGQAQGGGSAGGSQGGGRSSESEIYELLMDYNMNQAVAKGKFRWLVKEEEIGKAYATLQMNKNKPFLVLKEDDWPEMKDGSGNVIRNHYE